MKWKLAGQLLVIAVVFLASQAWAGPQLEIINPTLDFGKVTQNRVVTTDFWIKSTGDETLKIGTLWSGCGCTDIPLTDSTIDPGDSIQCRITFSTGRLQGLVHKRPTVRTNASEEVIKLSIMAEVMLNVDEAWPVVVRPDVLDVSQFGEKSRRLGKFHIENRSDEDLSIIVVDSALKSFQIRIPDQIKAGETVEGRIRVRDEALEADFTESITLRIKGLKNHNYTLPIVRRYRPAGN